MKVLTAIALAAVCASAVPASASYDEALEHCKAFATANSTSPDPCECIAKAIGDNGDLLAEQDEVKTLDDFSNASDAFKAAVNPCLPADQRA